MTPLKITATMPHSDFCGRLCHLNRLDTLGFNRWVLQPGMGFRESSLWWPPHKKRPRPHEGVDLCCFAAKDGRILPVPAASQVPPLYPGRVIAMFDDFLGTTIQLAHDIEINGCQLQTLYGHVVPAPGLHVGNSVETHQAMALIAASDTGRIQPHLHLSVILVVPGHTDQPLSWENIHDPDRAMLCDPLDHIDLTGGTGFAQQAEAIPEWQVYIVRCSDNTLYTGIAKDLAKRLAAHNSDKHGAKYTRPRRPVQLVYREPAVSRSAAAKREYAIKQLGLVQKLALIKKQGAF